MDKVILKAEQRAETGKGPARRLRQKGRVPGILYGRKMDPVNLSLDAHQFRKLLDTLKSNPVFDLEIDGGSGATTRKAMLKERQVRPINGELIHLDFMEVSMDEVIEVDVPLHFEGEPIGVEKGGSFQIVLRELRIEALPGSIPEAITVDVSSLDMGHSLHVSEITLPEGVKSLADPGTALATILAPKKEKEEVEEEPEPEEPQ